MHGHVSRRSLKKIEKIEKISDFFFLFPLLRFYISHFRCLTSSHCKLYCLLSSPSPRLFRTRSHGINPHSTHTRKCIIYILYTTLFKVFNY